MKRPANADKVLERVQEMARDMPDLTIRRTFIAGFPGETEEHFQTLLDFTAEPTSIASGASRTRRSRARARNDLDGALPDEVREERRARFMELAEELSAARMKRKVGQDAERCSSTR